MCQNDILWVADILSSIVIMVMVPRAGCQCCGHFVAYEDIHYAQNQVNVADEQTILATRRLAETGFYTVSERSNCKISG